MMMSSVYKMHWRQGILLRWSKELRHSSFVPGSCKYAYSASWVRPSTQPRGWGWVHPFTLLVFSALEIPTRVGSRQESSVKFLPWFSPQSLGAGRVNRLTSNRNFQVCRFSSNSRHRYLVRRFFLFASHKLKRIKRICQTACSLSTELIFR